MEPTTGNETLISRIVGPFKLLTPVLWMFLGTMILANIAGEMEIPFVGLYVQSLGANVQQVGLFFTLGAVAPLLLQVFGGWLSDSMGRLQAIAIGSVGGMVGYLIYILASSWQWLLIATIFMAMTFSFVGPSFAAFIAEQSTEENRGRVYGLTQTMFTVVGVIGPPIGAAIAQNLNFKTLYIVAGSLYAVAALMRIGMARWASKRDAQRGAAREKPSLANLKNSMVAIAGMIAGGGIVTWLFVIDGVSDVSEKLSRDLIPLYLENILDLSLVEIGSLMSVSSITTMLLSGFGGWFSDRYSERATLALGFVASAVGMLILVLGRSYVPFVAAWMCMGASWALIGPAYNSLISKAVPENLRGIAFGLFATSLGFISLPAPWIGAQLWERFTPLAPFILTMIALLFAIPIILLKFKLPAGDASIEGE